VKRHPRHPPSLSASVAVRAAVALAVCAGLVVASPGAHGQTVTLSGSAIGSTPSVLGYNTGHFMPGSNTASWWKYSGVNGGRIFSSPSYLTPGTSSYFRSESTLSLSATTQAQFVTQRDALRASGTATTYIRWDKITPLFTTGTTTGNNNIQLKYAEDSMKSLGVKPLIVMTRSPSSYPWPATASANAASDWQDRWLAWQQWYAQAFIHAQYDNVENYQLFNEPDLYTSSSATLSQEQWIEMMRYGSNAIESAIADVNRLYGKSLKAHVYGPVTNGPSTTSGDWGNTLLLNRTNQVITGPTPGYQLFDHFDYHNYGSSPATFGTKLAGAITDINTATGGQGASYPVTISEFNTRTSTDYTPNDPTNNPNNYTPDTLDMSSRLGQILVNLANNKPDELYLFKFSNAGGANNGVYWQADSGSVNNVGGASRSAMAYQLFTEGFTANTLLKAPTSSDSALTMAAAYDAAEGKRYAYIANESSSASKSMTLDLTSWNVAVGSTVTVKQVSGLHQGGISQTLTVPANRTITVNADPFGVVLVTAPTVSGLERRPFTASENAYVQESGLTTNYSGSATLLVKSGSTTANHNAAYLKFAIGSLDPTLVADATLSITALDPAANDPTKAGIVCHVYGITNTAWRQATSGSAAGITWSTAPNISQSSHPTTRTTISQNYLSGVGTSADIIGQFAATGTTTTLSVDVSRWIAERVAAGDTSVSFMITRDVRFDGDFDNLHSLAITSREGAGANTTLAPTLTLSTRTAPITISVASGSQTQLQTGNSMIRGTSPVTKTGAGTVIYDVANTTTGATTIQAGTLRVAHALGLAASPTTIQAGSQLLVDPGITLKAPRVTLAGGTLTASTLAVHGTTGIGILSVSSGVVAGVPAVSISGSGLLALSATSLQSLDISALTIDQASGGKLDLGKGSITIASGGMSSTDLLADLNAGFADGAWNGASGIVSSAVASAQAVGQARTIGWMDNPDGGMRVAFVAPGDTNLDGTIDLLDAANMGTAGLFDTGQPAGWMDGDFNYDGIVDIVDAAAFMGTGLFDTGFYEQSMAGAVAAVPEPSGMALIGLAAAIGAVAGRKRPGC